MAQVKAAGGITRKVKWLGRSGAPDQFAAVHRRCFFVELKRPVGGRVKGDQAREAEVLRGHGATVFLGVNTKEWVDQILLNAKEMNDEQWRRYAAAGQPTGG